MGCSQSSTPSELGNVSQLDVKPDSASTLLAKVVLLGDSGVGKTSIALRLCQNRFPESYDLTIGAAFMPVTMRLQDGRQIDLRIWDTGGHERFRAMTQLYYRDALGAVIVYDVGYARSFDSVKYWFDELRQRGPSGCCIAVAGNKADTEFRQIDEEGARRYCENEQVYFRETSAKSGLGISDLFEFIATSIASRARGESSDTTSNFYF